MYQGTATTSVAIMKERIELARTTALKGEGDIALSLARFTLHTVVGRD